MTISIIAALDENNAIGKNNDLLCYISADLKRFKALTTGHTILMGRKTFESLPKGALPNRRNVVLTRNSNFKCENCEIVHTINEAFNICMEAENVFIIGGAQIYNLFIEHADRLFLTRIHNKFEADTYFPEFDLSKWNIENKEEFEMDEKNKFKFLFIDYTRK